MNGTRQVLRAPSAWLPIVLSLAASAFVVGYVAVFGVVASADERAPARIFQLMMLAVAAGIVIFAARWLPRAPRAASVVLVLQVACAALPIAAILIAES